MHKFINIIARYQKYFLGLAIFLSLCAVSINISAGEIKLILTNYPVLMLLLVVISILCALLYIAIDKRKIDALSNTIKENAKNTRSEIETQLSLLTGRQEEVYHLIVSGKSNKEIMAELFIEQSTLKSHINQIYKKLEISNRVELRSKLRP